jgi:DNA repair protein RadC
MYKVVKIPISAWAEEDRPREKLLIKGRHVLSDAELLAIIIGTGNRQESAVDLAKRILMQAGNHLDRLARLSLADLRKFAGVGEAKAIGILAAFELGRRRNSGLAEEEPPMIRSSEDSYRVIRSELEDLDHEEFWVLILNRASRVIRKEQISRGGISSTVVDPKIIFKAALTHGASSIVVCHNHPSGNLIPSENDLRLTRRLTEAALFLEIDFIDHIIVGTNSYFSFADDGLL